MYAIRSYYVLSGYADFEYAKKAIANRADGYLLKPVDEDELIQYLHRIKQVIDETKKTSLWQNVSRITSYNVCYTKLLRIAAQNLGARGFKLFRTITLKLALPGVINAFLLVAINCFADFGNPKLIGGNYSLLAVEIYGEIINNEPGLASVMGIILVIPALLVFWLQNKVLSKGSYQTVSGKPVSGLKRITTSKKTDAMLFTFNSLISLFIIMMFGITILFAFTKNFGRDNSYNFV